MSVAAATPNAHHYAAMPQYRHPNMPPRDSERGMSSTPSKNERLAQALAAREPNAHLHRKSSTASSASEDQFRDVQDEFPADDIDDAGPSTSQLATPSLGQGRRSNETAWDENEFQRQAADRMSKYSMMTRYEGEGEGDDDVEGNDVTYGHNRTGSVGSSIWAGQGAIPSPNRATSRDPSPLNSGGQSSGRSGRKKGGGGSSNIVPPLPTSSAAFQHFRNEIPTPADSPPAFPDDDDGPFGRPEPSSDLRSAFNTPNPDADDFDVPSSSTNMARSTRASPGAATNGSKPGKAAGQRKGRSKRSPVLSYDGAAEDEERRIRASAYEEEEETIQPTGMGAAQGSQDGLQRHISHLGPKVRKHEPAPWELQADDDSEGSSWRSSPMSASPQPQSTWSKLTRGSLDVRDREAGDTRRGLGLGVNLRRPSGDSRRPSDVGSAGGMEGSSRQRQASYHSVGSGGPSPRPRHPLEHSSSTGSSGSTGGAGGIPAHEREETFRTPRHPSQASLPSMVSMPTTPTASSNLAASQNAPPPLPPIPSTSRPSDSIYSTTSTISGPGTPGKAPRPRTKSVSKVLKGLGIGSGSSEKEERSSGHSHDSGFHSNKLAKALKKKGERNELSLSQGISSEDFKNAPAADSEQDPNAHFDLTALRNGANKNLVNPLTGRAAGTASHLGAAQGDTSRSTSSMSGQIPSISTAAAAADGTMDSGISHGSAQPSDGSHNTRGTTDSVLYNTTADASHSYSSSSKATSLGTAESAKAAGLAPRASASPSRQLAPSPATSAYGTPQTPSAKGDSSVWQQRSGTSPAPSMNAGPRSRQESLDSTRAPGVSPSLLPMPLPAYPSSSADTEQTMDTMRAASATPTASGVLGAHSAKAQQNIERRSSPQPPSPLVTDRAPLPAPGSHEGVSYKLISLEQAQAEAKARQQAHMALQRSGSYSGQEDSASSSGEHGRLSGGSGSASAAMMSDRSHSSMGGGASEGESSHVKTGAVSGPKDKTIKGKKSGILRMFNRGNEKHGNTTDDFNGGGASPVPAMPALPKGSVRDFEVGGDKLGELGGSTAGGGGLSAPALDTIRPVSSMLAGLSPALIGDKAPASMSTSSDVSHVEAAANALEGKQSLPAPKANHLAASRGHSPTDIAILPQQERKSRDQAKTPTDGSGARESSVFHSPATSPGHLPMSSASDRPSEDMPLPSRPTKAAQRSASEVGQTLALPGADGRPRQLSVSSSSAGSAAGSNASKGFEQRQRMPSSQSIDSETSSNNHLGVVNGFPSAAPHSPASSSAANDDLALAVKNRVATIESQMAALVDELRHLRQTHMPNVPLSSSPLPDTGAGPMASTSPVPSCHSCGCNCAEMRRLQAINETQTLKALGTSVMDRGRGVKKRQEETASRFGGM